MPDKSPVAPETEGDQPSATNSASASRPTGGNSLLADLLSETSNEAQRELDQIKAELESRKHAELEARRTAERQRRAELDRLREAELKRREAALRTPEESKATPAATALSTSARTEESVVFEVKSKNNGVVYAIAAVLIAAIGTAGWYFTTKEKVKAGTKATATQTVENAPTSKTTGGELASEANKDSSANDTLKNSGADPTATAKKEPIALPVVVRFAAAESESYDRRVPEFAVPNYVKSKRRTRRSRKARGPGKGKIKIRGLNLGAGR